MADAARDFGAEAKCGRRLLAPAGDCFNGGCCIEQQVSTLPLAGNSSWSCGLSWLHSSVFHENNPARITSQQGVVCFATSRFQRRQITWPLLEHEERSLKTGLRQYPLPKVLFATYGLPTGFFTCLEKGKPYVPVKAVLAAVIMRQRGTVMAHDGFGGLRLACCSSRVTWRSSWAR